MRFVGDRMSFLVELCKGKRVLHLGCAASPDTLGRIHRGEHLHALLGRTASELYGIDKDSEGLAILARFGFHNLYRADVQDLQSPGLRETFDLVLAAEIIEHLGRPMSLLEGVKRFLRYDSLLCVTSPNALSLKLFLHNLLGHEMTGPDHLLILSPQTLSLMLNRAGFEVVGLFTSIEKHRGIRNKMSAPALSALFRIAPRFADSLVVTARVSPRG